MSVDDLDLEHLEVIEELDENETKKMSVHLGDEALRYLYSFLHKGSNQSPNKVTGQWKTGHWSYVSIICGSSEKWKNRI